MDDQRPARLITRDELAFALRESKKPGAEVIFGAVGGLVQQAIDARTHSQAFDWRAGLMAAAIGAALLWLSRIILNVWRAPRLIAAEDRRALESSYERLQARLKETQRELDKRKIATSAKLELLVFLHSYATSIVQDGNGWLLLSKPQGLDAWMAEVERFKQSLVELTALHLTAGERVDVLAAFSEVFPTDQSPYHVDAEHAEVWERMRVISKALGELVKKYEHLSAVPESRHLDA
jgi:hypothetical protein